MDAKDFLQDLVDSYPEGLRPDQGFTTALLREIRKIPANDTIYQEVLAFCANNFRMFPVISDIRQAFVDVREKISKGYSQRKGQEWFELNGKTFTRSVNISATGEVVRDPLPLGATDYFLWVPEEFQADRNYIDAHEAFSEGLITLEMYKLMAKSDEKASAFSRFKKIGDLLHKEDKKDDDPELFVDDSMAANPEEPVESDKFDDI